jgi:hypothetical protein
MSSRNVRREYVLAEAVRAGKFSAKRAAHWRKQYDRDPASTEAALAMLAPALDGPQPYPRDLFPELAKKDRGSFRALRSSPAATAPAPAPSSPSVGRTGLVAAPQVLASQSRGQPPQGALPGRPSADEIAAWSNALGFQRGAATGRVMRAGD